MKKEKTTKKREKRREENRKRGILTSGIKLGIKRRVQNRISPSTERNESNGGDASVHEGVHVYGCGEVVPRTAEEAGGVGVCCGVCVGGLPK